MSSKLKHRCTTGLTLVAILILVAVIVTVWVMLGQGAFRQRDENAATKTPPTRVKQKEYIEKSLLDDFSDEVEFVKPLKISPQPLHTHDIIFDQMRNNQDQPPLRHHSGHFRHREAEIWDPHPRYVIEAFGRKLFLELEHDDRALDPNLHVTHVGENFTHRMRQDSRIYGCYYSGKIKDDSESSVSVSLCNGMTGYIRTSLDNYYIEPAEKSSGEHPLGSFLHRIKRIPHNSTISDNDVVNGEFDQCETNDDSNAIDDDFSPPVVAFSSHPITKRQITFDDIADATLDNSDWPIYRKTNEYFLKVLVVADSSMAQYHQSAEDLKHYILIVMSHAALLYKDASIGNSIALSVVNIWIMNNTSFTKNNSQVMLHKFCEWQQRYVTDRKHDVALLFTRDPICLKTSSCNSLGVAEVGTICDPSSNCAIVRDSGLSSSVTVAHEIGHVLNMQHDETDMCSHMNKIDKNKYGTIMTRVLNKNTKNWRWSDCSKHSLTEFLESNKVKCLLKSPASDYITPVSDILPGENFEADKQCELDFGSGFRLCSYKPPCASLWCTDDEQHNGCQSKMVPWADGTTCGKGRWCQKGECVPLDRQMLAPVPGGWGSWQPWSECSRTCGGGVKHSKRFCDSPIPENGGSYCTGRSVQYISCNTQPCENEVLDFREVQCAQFDGITKNIADLTKDVRWVPKYGLERREDICKLFCRPKNSNAYYLLKNKVIDGTKCGLNSFDICVSGICRPGGCDNKLSSKVDLDDCGICGGDNSKCQEVTGNYNISMPDYHRVLRIPKGSSNIDIRQNANNDTNYLVLVDGETGDYVLNSKTVISPQQKDVIFGGVIISYSGSAASIERITTPKNQKLTKDLVLWVLSAGEALPPDITYRYIISEENAPRYGWRLYGNKWSKCNSICSGTQHMHPICVELATNKEHPDSYCSQYEKQTQMQKKECNTHCELRWNVFSRGPCSVNCGEGVRTVHYHCVKTDVTKENYDHYHDVVDHKHCNLLPKPPVYEACQGTCESTRWEYSNWSECSVSCGGGIQRRSAHCTDNNSRILDDTHCSSSDKITDQHCNLQKCPVWKSQDWTPCSVTCGRGFRTKPYYCHIDGRILDSSACDPHQIHIEKEECFEKPCAGWSVGSWSECSVTCGEGINSRKVICRNLDTNQQLEDHFCLGILKPNHTNVCKEIDCPYQRRFDFGNDIMSNAITKYDRNFRWVTGAWSQCSKPCGGGVSSRMVVCRNDYGEENDNFCPINVFPVNRIDCNTHPCPHWEYGGWSDCDFNCERRRQVTCRNATGSFVADVQCDNKTKPPVTIRCKPNQCQSSYVHYNVDTYNYKWSVSKWKPCSTQCGEGKKYRHIVCKDVKLQTVVVDNYCKHLPKPKTNITCEKYMCNGYAWVTLPWTQCSHFCGEGFKNRSITCHKVYQKGAVDPSPISFDRSTPRDYCDWHQRPDDKEMCWGNQCNQVYVWRTGPWKECTHPCGKKGRTTRQVYCYDVKRHQKVEKRHCPRHSKPRRRAKCNQWKCLFRSCKEVQHRTKTRLNKDYLLMIRNKPAWVYCYKMDTNQPEEYITLHRDSMNYAENYAKRLKNPHSCPYDGRRLENCDCLPIGPERSGRTIFWKVRLNITSLRIIGDDFTFSRQHDGTKVPFGTAGDCYSAKEGCAQGRFSIDLSKTSFRLAGHVRWQTIGKYATVRTVTSERRVDGLCGGYCGNCVPEPGIGLQVEIT